jgi:hypothetical protein
VYGFSSLVKQNKKGKNCAVFCFAGFCFLNFFCYEVIVKQKKKNCAEHYYSFMLSAEGVVPEGKTKCNFFLSAFTFIFYFTFMLSAEGGAPEGKLFGGANLTW